MLGSFLRRAITISGNDILFVMAAEILFASVPLLLLFHIHLLLHPAMQKPSGTLQECLCPLQRPLLTERWHIENPSQ